MSHENQQEVQPLTKRQRRELRKQEKVREREHAQRKSIFVRIFVWGGAAVIVGIVWYVSFIGSRSSSSNTNSNRANPALGPQNASVVITEYSDLTCPACAAAAPTVEEIAAAYPNDVTIVFNGFNLGHRWSEKSHEAGECAFDQGKFWEFQKLAFSKQSEWADADDALDRLKAFAEQVGMNRDSFAQCLDSGSMADEVDRDTDVARDQDISSTPTFDINGEKVIGAQSLDEFKAVIDGKLGTTAAENINQ
ncbi:MAG: thioredoxin domain-containing protein [Patescibacteria group bacterium]|nr:thioredoxin domain-containing protein [Patescibacteria group bacterium]MDD5715670.1 thioredoxin domain-containing protein [Patescibacteria group bacterium]